MPAPDDHFAAAPHRCVRIASVRDVEGGCRNPTVPARTVSATSIQAHSGWPEFAAPDYHLAAGPDRAMRISRGGRIVETRGDPAVRGRIISAAGICIVERFIDAAPNDHFVAAPHCCVVDPAWRYIHEPSGCPTVRAGIVSAAGMQIVHRITSTPNNHFATGPHRAVLPSSLGRVDGAGRRPTVTAGIVSAASIKVAITTTSDSAPDDHLAARPDRRVIGSHGRCISGAGRCPTVGNRTVSAASVQKLAGRGEPAPDDQLATCPHRALTASCLRCVGRAGRRPGV